MVKKIFFFAGIVLVLGACLPAAPETNNPAPISDEDLRGTAAVLSELTLQAIDEKNKPPSETPVIETASQTPEAVTPTETQNPVLLTLTATLGTGTPGSTAFDGTASPIPSSGNTGGPTTPQVIEYGTLAPAVPSGILTIYNKSNVEAYIAFRGVLKGGNVTHLEYPVKVRVEAAAPSGKYTYIAWIGGRQFTGNFSLAQGQGLLINLFKDKVTIKNNN